MKKRLSKIEFAILVGFITFILTLILNLVGAPNWIITFIIIGLILGIAIYMNRIQIENFEIENILENVDIERFENVQETIDTNDYSATRTLYCMQYLQGNTSVLENLKMLAKSNPKNKMDILSQQDIICDVIVFSLWEQNDKDVNEYVLRLKQTSQKGLKPSSYAIIKISDLLFQFNQLKEPILLEEIRWLIEDVQFVHQRLYLYGLLAKSLKSVDDTKARMILEEISNYTKPLIISMWAQKELEARS